MYKLCILRGNGTNIRYSDNNYVKLTPYFLHWKSRKSLYFRVEIFGKPLTTPQKAKFNFFFSNPLTWPYCRGVVEFLAFSAFYSGEKRIKEKVGFWRKNRVVNSLTKNDQKMWFLTTLESTAKKSIKQENRENYADSETLTGFLIWKIHTEKTRFWGSSVQNFEPQKCPLDFFFS